MSSPNTFITLLLTLSLISPSLSTLTLLSPPSPLLQSYGSTHTTLTFLLSIPPSNQALSSALTIQQSDSRPVITGHNILLNQLDESSYNVTLTLDCDAWVGNADFTVQIQVFDSKEGSYTEKINSGIEVFGLTIYTVNGDGVEAIVSGDDGEKVSYGSYLEALLPPRMLKTVSYRGNALADVDVQQLKFSVRDYEESDVGGSFLVQGGVYGTVEGDIALAPRKYRVGSGLVMVGVEWEELEVGGEVFETGFVVAMGQSPEPPAVVETEGVVEGDLVEEGVQIGLKMFNLGAIEKMWARGGGWVFEGSVSGMEEGVVKLKRVEGEGSGEVEVVVGGVGVDGEVEVVMTGLLRVRVADMAEGSVVMDQRGDLRGATWKGVWGIVVGVVVGTLMVAVVAGLAIRARWSRVASERQESSMSGMGTVPFECDPVYVARDVYGRGSLQVGDV